MPSNRHKVDKSNVAGGGAHATTSKAHTSSTAGEKEDPMIARARRLGCGFDLALRVMDPDIHVSLVYFNDLKSQYEQQQVKEQAEEVFLAYVLEEEKKNKEKKNDDGAGDDGDDTSVIERLKTSATIDVIVGDKVFDRSFGLSADLVGIQQKLQEKFSTIHSVRDFPGLHVDPRGLPLPIVESSSSNTGGEKKLVLKLFDNWLH